MNEKIGYTRELVSFKTSLAWTFNQRTGNRVCYLYMLYKRGALAFKPHVRWSEDATERKVLWGSMDYEYTIIGVKQCAYSGFSSVPS